MREVAEDGVRASPANRLGGEVEVIIVEHDPRRTIAPRNLRQHRVSERPVERHVALAPRAHGRGVDHGPLGEVPELVLQEPEQGVGDDVVGPLEDRSRHRREAEPHRLVGHGPVQGGRTVRRTPIRFAHGRCHPGERHVAADLRQRGDHAAGPAPGPKGPVRQGAEAYRPSIGSQDQSTVAQEPLGGRLERAVLMVVPCDHGP